jgi:hypothetical protein
MLANPNQIAETLTISISRADALEETLYQIEELSVTMQQILDADFHPDHALCAIAALRKEVHRAFENCFKILEEDGIIKSARVPVSNREHVESGRPRPGPA